MVRTLCTDAPEGDVCMVNNKAGGQISRLGNCSFYVVDGAAALAKKMVVVGKVCTETGRRALEVHLFHKAASCQGLQRIVHGRQRNRRHAPLNSLVHICRGWMIP